MYDKYFQNTTRDADWNVTAVDVYPRHGEPRAKLEDMASKLIKIVDNVFELLSKEGSDHFFNLDKDELVEFGKKAEDQTRGRKRKQDHVTDEDVVALLGGVTVPQLVTKIRFCLKMALENIEGEITPSLHTSGLKSNTELPKYGTGLPMVYRNLEYRLERDAAFDCTDDARLAVTQARSLEKLACSDWAEQGKEHAHSMAARVRTVSPVVSTELKAEIIKIVQSSSWTLPFKRTPIADLVWKVEAAFESVKEQLMCDNDERFDAEPLKSNVKEIIKRVLTKPRPSA